MPHGTTRSDSTFHDEPPPIHDAPKRRIVAVPLADERVVVEEVDEVVPVEVRRVPRLRLPAGVVGVPPQRRVRKRNTSKSEADFEGTTS
jgi:hypothetical protein